MLNDILAVYAFLNGIALVLMIVTQGFNDVGLVWLNPKWVYDNVKVNWFGAGFLAFVGNALFIPFSVCYWLYKLCTVGRN